MARDGSVLSSRTVRGTVNPRRLWSVATSCRHTRGMSTTGGRDRARRLVLVVGVVVLGLAIALGVFIQYVRDPRPPEDVPRTLAIPAVYATMGLLAIIGALQRRPAIVVGAGVLCLVGMILSVATIEFAVPGVLLILPGRESTPCPRDTGQKRSSPRQPCCSSWARPSRFSS